MMKDIMKRLNALEQREHPAQVHVLRCHADDDEEAAINAYGRERIRSDDLVVVLQQFC